MKIMTKYGVKIKHYNHIFKDTVAIYRNAVDFLIDVCLKEWDNISQILYPLERRSYVEHLIHITKDNPVTKYDFDGNFYKFPSYLRRSAITEAIGKVSSYKSNLLKWETEDPKTRKKQPGIPKAGYVYPCLYRGDMYKQVDDNLYEMQIKIFIRNTWDWIKVSLRKSDVDYIERRCKNRKKCAPTLQKRGKQWFLDFPFEEHVSLGDTDLDDRKIVAVDLGINSAATVSVMCADGTVLGRHFLKLSKEEDSLKHAINRIKKAQQHGNRRMPRLWARAKGINDRIAVRTAQFIMDVAVLYDADVIVFEHLDLNRKKRGSKKQRLHLWKAKYVQAMVTDKAHRLGMRISHVNAWGTSRLAYDGSGYVLRGEESDKTDKSYSVCEFQNGKVYNCDLNATYNIGARYFIRERLKSLNESLRLQLEAEVPQVCKRSTCTFSTLISMNAGLVRLRPTGF